MDKYHSIDRFGKRGTKESAEGQNIIVMEKIDGANASFRRNLDGELECFSRNQKLDEENTLRGFYQWAHDNIDVGELHQGVKYFGEWTTPHKMPYGDNHYKFYLFDMYDEKDEEYLDFRLFENHINSLGLKVAPIFYEGEFQSVDHISSFVGKSEIGEKGEGVVVKAYEYKDRFGKQIFTKFVSDEFAEKQKVKKHNPSSYNALDNFIDSSLTKARVHKLILKLVDEGKLHEEYGIEDMGAILKGLGSTVYEDIIKEELDELLTIIKKSVGRKVPLVVKEVLKDEGRM